MLEGSPPDIEDDFSFHDLKDRRSSFVQVKDGEQAWTPSNSIHTNSSNSNPDQLAPKRILSPLLEKTEDISLVNQIFGDDGDDDAELSDVQSDLLDHSSSSSSTAHDQSFSFDEKPYWSTSTISEELIDFSR